MTREAPIVVVVEDESIVALSIRTSLEKRGYRVANCYPSGELALEAVDRDHPDVIIMDINLKGQMDGIETARRVRDRIKVALIFMTGFSDVDARSRAEALEPLAFLVKPLDVNRLDQLLSRA